MYCYHFSQRTTTNATRLYVDCVQRRRRIARLSENCFVSFLWTCIAIASNHFPLVRLLIRFFHSKLCMILFYEMFTLTTCRQEDELCAHFYSRMQSNLYEVFFSPKKSQLNVNELKKEEATIVVLMHVSVRPCVLLYI